MTAIFYYDICYERIKHDIFIVVLYTVTTPFILPALYHTAGCSRLLALCLSLSLCVRVLAITAPHSNAKSQRQ